MNNKTYLTIWSVFLLVVITIGLRLLFVQNDFWYDEACSWFTASQSFPLGIIDNLLTLDLQHTPLYFFILHFWMKLFGDSEVAIRSLSLIFGVATVPIVYFIVNKLSNKTNAIMAVCIAAVTPMLVFFSVEARMYSMAVFLVVLSLNFLIDFEQKGDKKSLIKLVLVNVLLPYTFVGGFLYNLTLFVCYGFYLLKSNKDKFLTYLKGVLVEIALLIPFIAMVSYYANMRSLFVIKREGVVLFSHFVDVIRNFFGLLPVGNIYWPSEAPYQMTLTVLFLIIVPCVYFVYGYVQGFIKSKSFYKMLYILFTLILVEFFILALLQVNVFTVRYVLYLLPPFLCLSIIGLSERISLTHLKAFVCLYFITAIGANIHYLRFSDDRTFAFKAVRLYADEFGLNNQDIVIMPFGADAPYYFRDGKGPKVLFFDFHKQVRDPNNEIYYDKNQHEIMKSAQKYKLIHDVVFSNFGFSKSHFEYFVNNVNAKVPKGRYVLIALFSTDAQALVPIEELRKSITSVQDIKDRCLEIMLKKYLYDITAYLAYDFELVRAEPKETYSYLLYKRK